MPKGSAKIQAKEEKKKKNGFAIQGEIEIITLSYIIIAIFLIAGELGMAELL